MIPKVYKLQKFEIFGRWRPPWGVSNGPKMLSRKRLLLFYVTPSKKKRNIIIVKYSQKYFESTFG